MSGTQNTHIVKTFLNAMAVKDYDKGLVLVADACVYENLPMGKTTGPAGVRGVLEPFFASTLENDLRILREAASGDVVFVERLDRHRLADRWVELPVTGVFEVRDGKITVWREYFDLQTLFTAWPELRSAAAG
jgi:limonene-1,2-epoxide hydrolase